MTANKEGYLLDFFHKNGRLMSVCFWFVVIGQWTVAGNRESSIGAAYIVLRTSCKPAMVNRQSNDGTTTGKLFVNLQSEFVNRDASFVGMTSGGKRETDDGQRPIVNGQRRQS